MKHNSIEEIKNLIGTFNLKCPNRIINTLVGNLGADEILLYGVKGYYENDNLKSFCFCTNKRILFIKDIIFSSSFIQIPLNKITGAGMGTFLIRLAKIVISNAGGNQIVINYIKKNEAMNFVRVLNDALPKGEAIFL